MELKLIVWQIINLIGIIAIGYLIIKFLKKIKSKL